MKQAKDSQAESQDSAWSFAHDSGRDGGRSGAAEERHLAEIVLRAAALETAEREVYLCQASSRTAASVWVEARRRLAAAADLATSFLALPLDDIFAAPNASVPPDSAAAEADLPAVGPTLAPEERYEREELLGRGGMARVYRAYDRQLGRRVALKLLDHPEPATRRLFLQEARCQARVRHDNVLEVYETGELDDTPYIAMRYVAGRTLLEVREETSLEEQVELLRQVAEGLHAAHREGLLHRDVKPSNVLVENTPDGRKSWVADFGIAAREVSGGGAKPGDRSGTPYYMAPERLRAGTVVDRRADVYSLGVTMYQLFSGELPYDDTVLAEGLRQILEEEPPPLRSRVPDLPAELEAIVARCMAREPEARYSSARAVAADLKRYLEGEVVEAYAAKLAYRLSRFALRHKVVLTSAAVLVIALLAALEVNRRLRVRQIGQESSTSGIFWRLMLVDQVMPSEASERMERELLDQRRRSLGSEHPDVAISLQRLATVLQERGDLEGAERLFRKALDTWRRLVPEDHPNRGVCLHNLAVVLHRRGELAEAEQLFLRSLQILRRFTGRDEHAFLGIAKVDFAALLVSRGEASEAESVTLQALDAWGETLTAGRHWRRATARGVLGAAWTEAGRYEEAEALLLDCLREVRVGKGEHYVWTRRLLASLVRLYEVWEKPGKAAEYRARLEGARRQAGL